MLWAWRLGIKLCAIHVDTKNRKAIKTPIIIPLIISRAIEYKLYIVL